MLQLSVLSYYIYIFVCTNFVLCLVLLLCNIILLICNMTMLFLSFYDVLYCYFVVLYVKKTYIAPIYISIKQNKNMKNKFKNRQKTSQQIYFLPYHVLLVVHTLPRTITTIKPIHPNNLDNKKLPLYRTIPTRIFPYHNIQPPTSLTTKYTTTVPTLH